MGRIRRCWCWCCLLLRWQSPSLQLTADHVLQQSLAGSCPSTTTICPLKSPTNDLGTPSGTVSPPIKEEVNAFARFRLLVCLSVSKITQKRMYIWIKCCVSTDVGTWTNWFTFEPDPAYSPDAGTGLLSPISYALQRGILLGRENPTYIYWYMYRSLQRAVGTTLSEVGYMRSTDCPSS